MNTVVLVIHLLLAIALIGVILLQRSEGGGLGMSSSSSSNLGGMFSARGAANFLTRTTAILAASFMTTSLLLAIISSGVHKEKLIDKIEGAEVFKTGDDSTATQAADQDETGAPAVSPANTDKPESGNSEHAKPANTAPSEPQVPLAD